MNKLESDQSSSKQIEQLSAYAHSAWAGWMNYLFSKCTTSDDGSMIIPAWAVDRWQRQAGTSYADLPENEKASDRKEAQAIMAIVNSTEPSALKGEA